ncbi:DJ-1 family glyoxalase III [Porphyromonas sp. COT-290 OH860]|uniref:DJ-1 family glyoxalase III n=1 Tax=Porphyromonas sp. COT-290 OH860 TaxID=1515615 RepID=UPI00052DA237|nr:DJ-1 family glyoxalase III [Porphyromonas sp. COT-290 OH860]KGN83499.1 hypothetical protein HQ41_07165 [Porphyromonas sp. COT-290 OH860]
MAKNVYVFLAEGFEEIEAVATIDLLRRAGIATITVAVGNSLEVSGAHHITLRADKPLDEVDLSNADALVLPGGLPGVDNLNASEVLRSTLRQMYDSGRLVAAICAAPMILGQLGILNGKRATCYPSFENHLTGYKASEQKVITDGHVITACSAGVAIDFGLEIIKYLLGEQEAQLVADAIIYKR